MHILGEKWEERRGKGMTGEGMAAVSTVNWNWGITWLTEKAFAFKSIQTTASFSSVPFPLLAQGEQRCCHGSPVILPVLPQPRLTGLGTAAEEGSSQGQGCRARGGCLRRCLSKQNGQVLGKWREGPGGSALMRLWGVQRTSWRCWGLLQEHGQQDCLDEACTYSAIYFFMRRLGAERTDGGQFHLKNWSTWAGTGKNVKIEVNRNGTNKDDKRTENVNNTLKQLIGVGKLPKAGKLLKLVVT